MVTTMPLDKSFDPIDINMLKNRYFYEPQFKNLSI